MAVTVPFFDGVNDVPSSIALLSSFEGTPGSRLPNSVSLVSVLEVTVKDQDWSARVAPSTDVTPVRATFTCAPAGHRVVGVKVNIVPSADSEVVPATGVPPMLAVSA